MEFRASSEINIIVTKINFSRLTISLLIKKDEIFQSEMNGIKI